MARKKACPKPGTRKYGTKTRYTQKDLDLAIERIKKCEISQGEAIKLYNIPRSTIKYKLKNKHEKSVGRPPVLTKDEEELIVSHIIVLSELGLPLGMTDVRVIVKMYLDQNNRNERQFTNNLPGWEWGKLFLDRHPSIHQKIAHQICRKRAQINRELIEEYFAKLYEELADILPENIYNFDETGFHDVPKKGKFLFRRACRHPEVIKNSTKSCFTVMFCSNAVGEFVPPFIIYKAKQKWSNWIDGAPPGTRMAVTKSGWIDAETFDEWFEKQLLPILKKKDGKKAVIGDNLSSHITLKTLKICEDNNIKFICLLPNSTHLLQPLDVAYFSTLKTNWRKVLNDWRQTRRGKIAHALPKNVFAPLLRKTLELGEAKAPDNIKAGFQTCGIHPLNRDAVLQRLPNYGKPIHEIREEIGETFKNYLDEVRSSDLGVQTNRRKFQIPISAGKTVSLEEVEQFYKDKEKAKNTPANKKGRPIGSKNKNKKIKKTSQKASSSSVTHTFSDTQSNIAATSRPVTPDIQETHALTITTTATVHKPPQSPTNASIYEDNAEFIVQHNVDCMIIPEADNEVVIEEFEVQNDGCLKEIPIHIEEKQSGYCICKFEESLFPGRISQFDGIKYKISMMQKGMVGWIWPSKPDIISCLPKDVVKFLSDDKVSKKSSYFVIEDDFLYMEWGE